MRFLLVPGHPLMTYVRLLASEHALIIYAACGVAGLAGYLWWRRGRRELALRWAVGVLLAGVVLAVLSTTLTGSSAPGGRVNLVPGASILELTNDDYRNALENVLGNVMLFLPVGFLAVILVGRRVALVTTAAGALSVCIELTQLALGDRWVDIDDVLLNTFGGLLGALVGTVVLRLAAARHPGRQTVA